MYEAYFEKVVAFWLLVFVRLFLLSIVARENLNTLNDNCLPAEREIFGLKDNLPSALITRLFIIGKKNSNKLRFRKLKATEFVSFVSSTQPLTLYSPPKRSFIPVRGPSQCHKLFTKFWTRGKWGRAENGSLHFLLAPISRASKIS